MGTISPTKLLRLWKLEEITPEMAIGYLIQNQVQREKTLQTMALSYSNLRADVDKLIVHTKMGRKRKKPPKKD